MKIGLFFKNDKLTLRKTNEIKKILKNYGIDFTSYKNLGKIKCDLLLVIGDDRTILDAFLELEDEIPVLGISISGPHFLMEINFEDFETYLKRIIKGKYWVEKRTRLKTEIDSKKMPLALNEVVISASKPGSFLRYTLKIDGQMVWRDSGDGVIVSSPTGSTGYCLSSGGSILMENANALEIAPICSANMNRPIIVSDKSEICFYGLSSPSGYGIVIDGKHRKKINNEKIIIKKSEKFANFVRFDKKIYLGLFGKLREKSEKIVLPKDAPPSAKFIYKILEYEGKMTQKEIISESNLPSRTVRHSLDYLIDMGFIEKHLTLRDTRQSIYMIKN